MEVVTVPAVTEPEPLWLDTASSFIWCGRTVITYHPREPRAHLEPIEDEL